MAIQVLPQQHNPGASLGTSVGSGIRKHLEQLSQDKANHIKADQLMKATGIPMDAARYITQNLRPEDQWKAIQSYAQGAGQQQESNQQEFTDTQELLRQQLGEAHAPVSFEPGQPGATREAWINKENSRKQGIEQAQGALQSHEKAGPKPVDFTKAIAEGSGSKEQIALRKQGVTESNKWNKDARKTYEEAKRFRAAAEAVKKLVDQGGLRYGIISAALSDNPLAASQLNTQEQKFVKGINEMIAAKVQVGKGVPSVRRIALEQSTKPNLGQNPKAIKYILDQAIEVSKEAEKPYLEGQRLVKANKGRMLENLENAVNDKLGFLDEGSQAGSTQQAASGSLNDTSDQSLANLPDGTTIYDNGKAIGVVRGGKLAKA